MIIYYCITIIANIVAAIVFHKSINVTGLSVMPLFLIALMIFQSLIFKNEKVENGFRTAYGSNLTADEENKMLGSGSSILYRRDSVDDTVCFLLPIICKSSFYLGLYIGLVGGLLLYRIKNKGKIMNRMNAEDIERQEQEKREQLGKWK